MNQHSNSTSTNANLSIITQLTNTFKNDQNKETLWDLCSTTIFQNIQPDLYPQVKQIFDITINKISNEIQHNDTLILCNKRFLAKLHNDLPTLLHSTQPKSILKNSQKHFYQKKSDSTESIQKLYQQKQNDLQSYLPKIPQNIDLSDHTNDSNDDILQILEQQKKQRENESISFESILSNHNSQNKSNHITIHDSNTNISNDITPIHDHPSNNVTNTLSFLKTISSSNQTQNTSIPSNSSSLSIDIQNLIQEQKQTNSLLTQMNSMLSILCDELKRNT